MMLFSSIILKNEEITYNNMEQRLKHHNHLTQIIYLPYTAIVSNYLAAYFELACKTIIT